MSYYYGKGPGMNTPATTDAGLAHGTYRTQLLVNQKSIRVLKNLKKLRVEAHPNGAIPRRPEGGEDPRNARR